MPATRVPHDDAAAPPGSCAHDCTLGRDRRLIRSVLFAETFAQGRRYVGRCMVVWLRTGEGAALRLGVVTGRKVGNAVKRVLARRRLREAWRLNRWRFQGDFDVVIVARASLVNAPWPEVVDELLRLTAKAGLHTPDHP